VLILAVDHLKKEKNKIMAKIGELKKAIREILKQQRNEQQGGEKLTTYDCINNSCTLVHSSKGRYATLNDCKKSKCEVRKK